MIDLEQFEGHTDGPWVFRERNPWIAVIRSAKTDELVTEIREKGSRGVVDARLIAAAPTLLSELRAAREKIERLEGAVHEIVEECGNEGYPNPVVVDRMFERIHDFARTALEPDQ